MRSFERPLSGDLLTPDEWLLVAALSQLVIRRLATEAV